MGSTAAGVKIFLKFFALAFSTVSSVNFKLSSDLSNVCLIFRILRCAEAAEKSIFSQG